MTTTAVAGHAYALLADGATAEIRPAGPDDLDAVTRFHQDMSPDNLYLRFFSLSKRAGEQEARRVCRPADAGHAALLALRGPRVAGLASYELTGAPGLAEIAFAVADDMHGRGIATLLLEHLVSLGRARRVQAFTAATLPANAPMLRVDVRARVTSHGAADPFLRQLRMPPAATLAEPAPGGEAAQ
jgi:GNAT superfamily N-acetyltransferase